MNPKFFSQRPHAAGCYVMSFVAAMLSSSWEGSRGLSVEQMAANAASAYFVTLVNIALLFTAHGQEWDLHFIPSITARNVCRVDACALLRSIMKESAWIEPRYFAEKCCEHHFSTLKSSFTSTPSVKDCVLATQRRHLVQWRKPTPPRPVSATGNRRPLTDAEMSDICGQALERACKFMSWISHRVTPQQCHEALGKWWKISGQRWLSGKDGDDEPEEMEMDAAGIESSQPVSDPTTCLVAMEETLAVKKSIEDLQNAGETDEPADIAARTELEEMQLEERQGEEGACNLALGDGLAFVCQAVVADEQFSASSQSFLTPDGFMHRVRSLLPLLKDFVVETRLREGHLSRAQVLGVTAGARWCNEWNKMEHELALARQATAADGSRTSRATAWMRVTGECSALATAHEVVNATSLQPVDSLKSGIIVAYVHEGQFLLGQVLTIFRGSATSRKASASRRMRATKPSPALLPMELVAKVRVLRLTRHRGSKWVATAMSPTDAVKQARLPACFIWFSSCFEWSLQPSSPFFGCSHPIPSVPFAGHLLAIRT